jgi:hypothetical protein
LPECFQYHPGDPFEQTGMVIAAHHLNPFPEPFF